MKTKIEEVKPMHDKLTDAQLVEGTLEGDMSAFGILVNRYRGLVYGLAYHVVGSFHDAEDIAQEAFIKAYNSLSTLKDKAKFGSWLRTITLNLCKMWLRKSTKESLFETSSLSGEEDDEESSLSSLVTDVTPEDICINKEFQETVSTAISALPPKNQVVITLFYLDGLSYKEIGGFLNLPVSTVQSRLQRARKELKEEFLKMSKEIFQDNRLGPKFTRKVLDEIMAEGQKHLDAGEWSEAEAVFLKAIKIKPDHPEAHFHVALAKTNHADTHFPAGQDKEIQGLYEEAAEWFQKAAELKPNYAQAYHYQAQCLIDIDKDAWAAAYDKAIAAYKKLLELNPDDPELYLQLGEAYTSRGPVEDGIAALEQAIALKPDYVEAYAWLGCTYQGEAYLGRGDMEEAKKLYKQTTEIKVDSEQVYGSLAASRLFMAYNNLGGIYYDEGDYDQALFYLRKGVEKTGELGVKRYWTTQNLIVRVCAEKGANLAAQGKYTEAVAAYKEAIHTTDEVDKIHRTDYIVRCITTGKHLHIIDAFEDVIVRNPEDAEACYCLACLYSAKGDDSKASEALDKAVKLESSYQEKAKMSKFFADDISTTFS